MYLDSQTLEKILFTLKMLVILRHQQSASNAVLSVKVNSVPNTTTSLTMQKVRCLQLQLMAHHINL